MPGFWFVDLELPFVLIHAREHGRPPGEDRGVVDEEFRAKIVAAVEDDVVALNPPECIISRKTRLVGLDDHAGIDRGHRATSQFHFGFADIRQGVDRLTVQVAGIQCVRIHHPEMADPGAGQILQHRAAEAPGADNEHSTFGELCLPLRADFLQQELAGVIGRGGHTTRNPATPRV